MPTIEFDYRAIGDLKPDPRNARTHSKKQIEQIAASISATTFANPIIANPDGLVIAGHGRLRAARQLELAQVPVITLTGASEAQERALRLADNKIALNAGWDIDLLRVELDSIELDGLDLDLTGFSVGEIDTLRLTRTDPDDDVAPMLKGEPVTRPGDIWICGPHRVGCGDVANRPFLAIVMADYLAHAGFSDPPYNVKIDGHAGGAGRVKHAEFVEASGEMSPTQFVAFLERTLGACAAVSRPGAVHFVCMDHHHIDELSAAGATVYDRRLNIVVWVKSNAGLGSLYRSQHELIFVYRVGGAPHQNFVELGKHGRNRTNVWDAPSVNSFGGGSRRDDLLLHPTVKPAGLVAEAIKDVTKRGQIVLDGFLGSGTTLIAAERAGRRCFGIERAPHYVDVAVTRWAMATGGTPMLAATGETFDDRRRAGAADTDD